MNKKTNLSIDVVPGELALLPGAYEEIEIKVTNTGDAPAYWVHTKPAFSKDNGVRTDPPDNTLLGKKGEQPRRPESLFKIEPNETASVYARVTQNLAQPSSGIK